MEGEQVEGEVSSEWRKQGRAEAEERWCCVLHPDSEDFVTAFISSDMTAIDSHCYSEFFQVLLSPTFYAFRKCWVSVMPQANEGCSIYGGTGCGLWLLWACSVVEDAWRKRQFCYSEMQYLEWSYSGRWGAPWRGPLPSLGMKWKDFVDEVHLRRKLRGGGGTTPYLSQEDWKGRSNNKCKSMMMEKHSSWVWLKCGLRESG